MSGWPSASPSPNVPPRVVVGFILESYRMTQWCTWSWTWVHYKDVQHLFNAIVLNSRPIRIITVGNMASSTHVAIAMCQKTSALRIIYRVSLVVGVLEHLVKKVSHLCIRLINGGVDSGLFIMYSFQRMSSAVHPQSQVDFLNGAPHRKHPGVTNLKTLRLPEQLQRAAQSIVLGRCFLLLF